MGAIFVAGAVAASFCLNNSDSDNYIGRKTKDVYIRHTTEPEIKTLPDLRVVFATELEKRKKIQKVISGRLKIAKDNERRT